MSGLSGNISSLKAFSASLRQIPRVVAQKIAATAAPAITAVATTTFNSGENPYGRAWAPGADGRKITLDKTGALKRHIKYVATGTKIRVTLGVSYAKYQIGKRLVFPRLGSLPVSYVKALSVCAAEVIRVEVRAT